MFKTVLSIMFLISFLQISAGEEKSVNIREAFESLLPQQKVYLHLDKQEYYAGDILWFKAYVIKSDTHKPDAAETTLFVEIFNTNGTLIGKKILHTENGYASGDFSLPDSVNSGNHYIRAYTSWMLNFHEDFIFEKFFFVNNPIETKIINRREARSNRRINRELEKREEQFRIAFFPEGGPMIYGIESRIAFHATNELGEGILVEGYVSNSAGEEVALLKTSFQGKGTFTLMPAENLKYNAHVVFPDGKRKTFPIRDVRHKGHTLRVETSKEQVKVIVNSSFHEQNSQNNPYLVIHNHGQVQNMIQLENKEYPFSLSLNKDELTPGISVATLFNASAEVIAERLFFIPPPLNTNVKFELEKYSEEFIDLKIHFEEFTRDTAAYSVSVVAASRNIEIPSENIISNIFLSSDLIQPVQNPLSYFDHNNNLHRSDLLMMVSAWKRFRWSDLASDKLEELKYSRESKGFPIYGIITPTEAALRTDNTDFDVSLSLVEEGRIFRTRTDNKGHFSFNGFEEHGDFKAEISISGIQKSTPKALELFPDRIQEEEQKLNFHSRRLLPRGTAGWRFRRSGQPKDSDRYIKLEKESSKKSYGRPDQTLYFRENDTRFQNMREVLTRSVSGVQVDGNSIIIRGKGSIFFSNQPLILVDGVQYSSAQFLQLSVMDISSIEIFKGPNASIFGVRGSNGAIVAFSRRGSISERIIINYIMDGYYIPRRFTSSEAQLKKLFFEDENYTQTILFHPFLNLNNQGKTTLRIPMKQEPVLLIITIEGIDSDGNVIHATHEFESPKAFP
ncbi:MAG: hypothetical protein EA361_09495 [Bacteroidetes bacterium]|nr:MAG: hypothetical protein EA361_09495 [Bacteroidota bacterium]